MKQVMIFKFQDILMVDNFGHLPTLQKKQILIYQAYTTTMELKSMLIVELDIGAHHSA